MSWQEFEEDCYKHLKKFYSTFARFEYKGKSDSTVPDILVESNNGSTFYVEAKHSPAQSGQFVLLPNILTKEFDYSCKNTSSSDKFSNQIINYMNHFFEKYKEAGTKGIEINFPNCENVFFDWIIHKYRSSGVKYIITNGYNIIKLENIPMFFNVSATYRVKRSGSSSVGKKKLSTIQHYIENNYSISNIYSESDKLYVECNLPMHNKRFILDGTEYMFSLREDIYEIRKLSGTFNANVIFSLKLKDNHPPFDNLDFENYIK